MTRDKRSHKIVVVAHCILNQNSRVQGIAYYPGMIREIVDVLRKNEVGVIQMPCPELTYAGLLRASQTKEQYDTSAYRRYCRQIASSTADQIEEYSRNNFKVLAILGIKGSPTCGVSETNLTKVPGILMGALRSELKKRKIVVPMRGVKPTGAGHDAFWLKGVLTK